MVCGRACCSQGGDQAARSCSRASPSCSRSPCLAHAAPPPLPARHAALRTRAPSPAAHPAPAAAAAAAAGELAGLFPRCRRREAWCASARARRSRHAARASTQLPAHHGTHGAGLLEPRHRHVEQGAPRGVRRLPRSTTSTRRRCWAARCPVPSGRTSRCACPRSAPPKGKEAGGGKEADAQEAGEKKPPAELSPARVALLKAHSFGKSTPNHLVAKLLADAFFAQGDALPLASTAGHLPAREVHSVPPALREVLEFVPALPLVPPSAEAQGCLPFYQQLATRGVLRSLDAAMLHQQLAAVVLAARARGEAASLVLPSTQDATLPRRGDRHRLQARRALRCHRRGCSGGGGHAERHLAR